MDADTAARNDRTLKLLTLICPRFFPTKTGGEKKKFFPFEKVNLAVVLAWCLPNTKIIVKWPQ